MDRSDLFAGSTPGGRNDEAARIAAAVPRSLALLLVQLAQLPPDGRTIVLEGVGPGSRLLLEALRLADRGEPRLTELGLRVMAVLAGTDDATILPFRPRLRPIARVLSTRPAMAAATGDEDPDDADQFHFQYNLVPDRSGEPGEATARVEVERMGTRLRVWQVPGEGCETVVHHETMERLPQLGDPAMTVPNPDDEPPSVVLRRTFALTDEEDGENDHG